MAGTPLMRCTSTCTGPPAEELKVATELETATELEDILLDEETMELETAMELDDVLLEDETVELDVATELEEVARQLEVRTSQRVAPAPRAPLIFASIVEAASMVRV